MAFTLTPTTPLQFKQPANLQVAGDGTGPNLMNCTVVSVRFQPDGSKFKNPWTNDGYNPSNPKAATIAITCGTTPPEPEVDSTSGTLIVGMMDGSGNPFPVQSPVTVAD